MWFVVEYFSSQGHISGYGSQGSSFSVGSGGLASDPYLSCDNYWRVSVLFRLGSVSAIKDTGLLVKGLLSFCSVVGTVRTSSVKARNWEHRHLQAKR